MKLEVIKYLYYYEVPTVIFCQDERQNNFIFILLSDETYEYIGKKVNVEDVSLFLEGKMDLKPIYQNRETNLYIGKYNETGEFNARLYLGEYSDDLLPDDGLIMINHENTLVTTLKKELNRVEFGSQKSKVGQLERVTQNRIIKIMQDELQYRYLGNWEDRDNNSNVEESILLNWLVEQQQHDPQLADKAIYEFTKVTNQTRNLYDVNKEVYSLLRYGVTVQPETGQNKQTIWLIDWANPLNNDFAIAEEVTIKGLHKKRPDIVLYINGIALGVLELKRSTVSLSEGIRQNEDNQKHMFIQSFFNTMQYVMAGNELQGLMYGTIDTKEKYYLKWKEVDEEKDNSYPHLLHITKSVRHKTAKYQYRLDKNIIELLNKERFIELLHDFVVFDHGKKKLSRPNQYFGIKAAQDFIKRREGGIIWHTQGSGKSLTMVWLAKWIREYNPNARVLIITDRDELDEQIKKVFTGVQEDIYRTKSGRDLLLNLNNTASWLLCSLVHKFGGKEDTDEKDVEKYIDELRSSIPADYKAKGDVYVFVDECHRTQSGKLHGAMKQFIPNALFIGFTGTPLLNTPKTSLEIFGPYIHTYKFDEAVKDKVVLDLRYEARDIEQNISSSTKIDEWFELKTRGLTEFAKAELKQRWGTIKKVYSSKSRLEKIVLDIMLDMEQKERLQNGRGNAILVSDSIYNACRYYELFQNAGLKNCAIVTSFVPNIHDIKGEGENYTEKLQRFEIYQRMLANYFNEDVDTAINRVEEFETEVKKKFVESPAQMKLLIVVNKLLTGFDAPSATYLYIDKKLHDHNLFQAVCRVNRLDGEDKDYGYVIDYMDLFKSLEKAYNDYTSEALGGYKKEDVDGLLKNRLQKGKERLSEALEAVKVLIEPVESPKDTLAYIKYFCGDDTENPDQLKDTEPRRVILYKFVISLMRAYAGIADDMEEAGYNESEKTQINSDIKQFENLRKEIQIASGDYIDLKQYEPAMRFLIDSYIGAEDSRILANFDDMSLVEMLATKGKEATNDLPDQIKNDPDAMAEVIENNLRRVIIEESPTNPMYYEKMSVLLDELIKMRKEASMQYEKYLQQIVELSGRIKKPSSTQYPTIINTSSKRALFDNLNKNEPLVIELDSKIRTTKKDGWRDNIQKLKAVRNAISDVLKEYHITDVIELNRIVDLVKNQKEY
ncbi:type I restriction enzyme, R subunit [Mucilaginibacter sp. OK268]|uniref:type I restriction endonuclease subunit R n=1 Tax=Mucilaginibacter sp. OK268 TaxID=1881048 RepID=UPI00088DB2D9|nr:HsdR family type I site-specific deoxyribonuclease [Mucilaginibacter sp. OK268]SDP94803.1 type I restriction enzyme, R subunit [Mucilaginibacter sp. OK268]